MSAAPSWPLVIVALFRSDTSEVAAVAVPGLNFDPSREPEDRCRDHGGPDFVLQTFKTQNDVRGDFIAPPVRIISLRTAKARNCLSPNDLQGKSPPLRRPSCFRAAVPIWDGNHGDSRGKPSNPHTFSCSTCNRASVLQASRRGRSADPRLVRSLVMAVLARPSTSLATRSPDRASAFALRATADESL